MIAVPGLLLAIAAFLYAAWFYRHYASHAALERDRTRALKWRVKLWLRPGLGYAPFWELLIHFSRWDAMFHRHRSRTDMGFFRRLRSRTTRYAVRLGRAQYGRRCYSRQEDMIGVLAAQGSAKTATLAGHLLDHDGPCVVSSCRADIYFATARKRTQLGPVEIFNPQGVSGVQSTFTWDLLAACHDEMAAQRMADWLCGSTPGYGNIEWFESKGTLCLGGLLFAAFKGGYTMQDVFRWVHAGNPAKCEALAILHANGNYLMVHYITALLSNQDKTSASVRHTMDKTLQFLAIPQLAAAVSRGSKLDHLNLIRRNGTLYLVASGDVRSLVTPVIRALAHYIHYEAKMMASKLPRQRLTVPLLLAFDEVAVTCPVALAEMLSDAAGWGIMIYWIAHSLSQLEERYGKDDKLTIWANSTVKMLLPGNTNRETLNDASELCDRGHSGNDKFQIAPVSFIRMLPTMRALVIRGSRTPVVVKVRPYFKRLGYRWPFKGRNMMPVPNPAWNEQTDLPEIRTPAVVTLNGDLVADDAPAAAQPAPALLSGNGHQAANGNHPPTTWITQKED